MLIVGTLVFVFCKSVDYTTIFHSLKLAVPAGIVAYFGSYYLENILKTSKTETSILVTDTQKKFIDDLLLTPEQVLNQSRINISDDDSSDQSDNSETEKNEKN